MATKAKVAIIGCGNISDIYLQNCQKFDALEVVACSDLVMERAISKAQAFGITTYPIEEIFNHPEIDIVLNLTVPLAHSEVNLAALAAGKSVYGEKPLAVTRQAGLQTLALAEAKGLRVGCAPDTFLGAGLQTCRELIDGGAIGEPVAAAAFMPSHGPEAWHPDPEFFYKPGAGPMFDMGPYYLTALVSLLGPVKRVTGSARISQPERLITSQPKNGQVIKVEIPTHVVGILEFNSGAVGTIITSFDIWAANLPRIEIYGTSGTLSVPDPNTFGGPVSLFDPKTRQWSEVALTHRYSENSRGLGMADMAQAMRTGRPHRASGALAYHVLELMHAFHDASDAGRHIEMSSTCERPAPLRAGLPEGVLD